MGTVTRGALRCYVSCPTDRLVFGGHRSPTGNYATTGNAADSRARTCRRLFHTHSLAFVRAIGEAGDDEARSGSGSARISWCCGALPHRRGASGQVAAVGIVSPCFRRVRVERLRWESRDAGNRREHLVRGAVHAHRTEETKKSVRRRAVVRSAGGLRWRRFHVRVGYDQGPAHADQCALSGD